MPQSNTTGSLDLLTQHFGLWEGIVVDVDDPLNLGRCRVKVSGVHDLRESETPWNKVDWAEPCFPPGTFRPPIVGDMVWIMFRQGSVDHPVYMGIKYAIYEMDHVRGRIASRTPPVRKPTDDKVATQEKFEKFSANNKHTWWEPKGNTAPRETWSKKRDIPPEIYMIQRTPRGHTFYLEDTPTREKVVLIDRTGMMFKMDAGVVPEDDQHEPVNDYNMARRLDQNAAEGTQLSLDKVVGNTATILLIDLSEQSLEFLATSLSEEDAPDGNRVLLRGVGGFLRIRERGGKNHGGDKGEIKIHTSQLAVVTMDYGINVIDNNQPIGEKNDTFDMHDGKGLWDHAKRITIKVDPSSRIVLETESILIRSGSINIAADADVNISAGGSVNISAPKINLN